MRLIPDFLNEMRLLRFTSPGLVSRVISISLLRLKQAFNVSKILSIQCGFSNDGVPPPKKMVLNIQS